jgi:hypothetical protein
MIIAQNWSPILVNEKMNYRYSDSSFITNTIWVDSAFYVDNDSIFYLNRVVKDVPDNPEIALRNQPQFLSKFIIKQMYGIYICAYPDNYIIATQFGLGYTWAFTSSINAEITDLLWEEIFGVQDSVKVISLSDGNEIRLSKNFGILKFPDFENGGNYILVGIQGTEYGESVPNFWEIFDFEVGDVFQYKGSIGGGGTMYMDYYTQKYTITSKIIEQDKYIYAYEGIRKGLMWSIGSPWNSYGYSELISDELIFIDSTNHYANFFNGTLMCIWDSYSGTSFDNHTYARTEFYPDSIGVKTKQYGFIFNSDGFEVGELLGISNEFSDTVLRFTNWYSACVEGNIGVSVKEHLRITSSIAYYFEEQDEYYLEGYIKDDDTVGTITPDSLLLGGINDNKALDNDISVFPNPADEWLYIKPAYLNSKHTLNIELRNLYGQLVRKKINIQSSHYSVNVADLKAGVYFYVIKEQDKIIQQGKLIIK